MLRKFSRIVFRKEMPEWQKQDESVFPFQDGKRVNPDVEIVDRDDNEVAEPECFCEFLHLLRVGRTV